MKNETNRSTSERPDTRASLHQAQKRVSVGQRNETNMTAEPQTETDVADLAIELIRSLLAEMTIEPRRIQIEKEPFGFSIVNIVIRSDATNYGTILGAQKRHLNAFTAICKLLSARTNQEIQLSLEELPGGVKQRLGHYDVDEVWDGRGRIQALFQRVFDVLFDGEAKVVIATRKGGATAVEVLIGSSANPAAVEWLQRNLEPVIVTICSRQRRWPASLRIIRDQMLLDQTRMHE